LISHSSENPAFMRGFLLLAANARVKSIIRAFVAMYISVSFG